MSRATTLIALAAATLATKAPWKPKRLPDTDLLTLGAKPRVTIYVVLDETASNILHETTCHREHSIKKKNLKLNGHRYHYGNASGLTKFEVRAKIAKAQEFLAASLENEVSYSG